MIKDMNYRYFMFSAEHYAQIMKTETKAGNRFKPGKVLQAYNWMVFTSIVRDPEAYSKRYSDAKIVMSGDIRKIKYQEPSSY